ncbi:MAG TPA: hypothetical protein PKE69_13785 [Pyrinomonadaceae bacterium]|nr:hypothetical protein [Pyrinomonadaceae bacterium]
MSVTESTATALVRFTGMGIVNFSKSRNRGEIEVVRDGKHTLNVKIQKPVFKDGLERDVIVYEDVKVYENLPAEGVEISISTSDDSAVKGFEVYRSENFDRLTSEDFNYYNWVVSLENLHGENLVKDTKTDAFPTSNITIENGFYYAHKLDTNLFFEKIEKDAEGKEIAREVFGNVAETVGVKLEADEVVFTIKIGDTQDVHTFPRVHGLPVRIEIVNMDYNEDAVYSDMPEYYKYFADSSGTSFELEISQENSDSERLRGGSAKGTAFCHPIEGSGG